MASPISFRSAAESDSDAIADLVAGDASSEAAALAGGVEQAREFLRLLEEISDPPSWISSVVGVQDGAVCAVLQQGPAEEDIRVSARLLTGLIARWGLLAALRGLPRGLALQSVRIKAPAGSWVVREVHVRPDLRGRGIGTVLLRRAEESAVGNGRTVLALTTRTNNPARRLYERTGYRTVASRTNRMYRRYSGADGRILMVKELVAPVADGRDSRTVTS